ncbi:MAG: hypothetical protein DCC52_07410 [Chloroflexi bacterium]|nr:MAG: hypothetical protein DCC52_07410 [Chloroflexota bacterium]
MFFLILVVVYVPILATFFSPSPVCAPCLLLGMILLPLRHFLRAPERVIEQQHLESIAANDALLQQIAQAATETAQVEIPHVMVSALATSSVWTFGTFRRRKSWRACC